MTCGEFHKPAMRFGAGTDLDEIEGAGTGEQGLGVGVGVGVGDTRVGFGEALGVAFAKSDQPAPGMRRQPSI